MTPTIYTYDSLWGHCNSQEVGIVRSWAGRYLCGWIVIIVTNKNLLSQMKCVEARGRETPGFLSYHVVSAKGLRQGSFNRGASAGCHSRGTSTGGFGRGLRQGHFSWGDSAGVHRQEDLAGCYCRGTSTGMLQQGASAGALRQGSFGRGASTFSKYYEFPVTINGNIRLYCGTTRKRRQEKDYKRKQ